MTSHGNLADYRADLIALALGGNREAAFDLSRMYDWGLAGEKSPSHCWAWVRCARDVRSPMAENDTASAFRLKQASAIAEIRISP